LSPIELPQFDARVRFGAHMPTAGGLHNAIYTGEEVGCSVVQVFTKSPQQWKAREITDEHVELFLKAQADTGIPCLAAHDTYLINPCALDPEILQKSREALADELVRSSRLRIPYVVMHQGTQGDAAEEDACARLIDSVKFALDHAPDDGSVLLLETTAGQGKCMGHRFDQMARIMEAVDAGDRLGVCIDTCHIFAAGYDIRDADSYAATMSAFDQIVGLNYLKCLHLNDSKKGLGLHVDRHAHIGEGEIGLEGFANFLNDARLCGLPGILETPKESPDYAEDRMNLERLRSLIKTS
jgi:deoxyribonuclease IV